MRHVMVMDEAFAELRDGAHVVPRPCASRRARTFKSSEVLQLWTKKLLPAADIVSLRLAQDMNKQQWDFEILKAARSQCGLKKSMLAPAKKSRT